jgi:hypothetical protein
LHHSAADDGFMRLHFMYGGVRRHQRLASLFIYTHVYRRGVRELLKFNHFIVSPWHFFSRGPRHQQLLSLNRLTFSLSYRVSYIAICDFQGLSPLSSHTDHVTLQLDMHVVAFSRNLIHPLNCKDFFALEPPSCIKLIQYIRYK